MNNSTWINALHVGGEPETIQPTQVEVLAAQKEIVLLEEYLSQNRQVYLQAKNSEEIMPVSHAILKLLTSILKRISRGEAVTLIPDEAELTTQQAAKLLNVSRPFVVKMLQEGKIPFRMVGAHRRILAKDIQSYKAQIAKDRQKVLAELSAEGQDLKMGYD